MSERVISVPSMNEDHKQWQSRHSMWQDDLQAWEMQLAIAIKEAKDVLEMLEHETDVLSGHKKEIAKQETTLKTHEHEIASRKHFGAEVPEALTTKHFAMVKQAETLSGQHESIKKHHHELVAKINELQKSLLMNS